MDAAHYALPWLRMLLLSIATATDAAPLSSPRHIGATGLHCHRCGYCVAAPKVVLPLGVVSNSAGKLSLVLYGGTSTFGKVGGSCLQMAAVS